MSRVSSFVLLALAACGGGHVEVSRWSAHGTDALLAAHGDAARIRAMLRAPVAYGGLVFDDGACTAAFPVPGNVRVEQLDTFARCLSRLPFREGHRRSSLVGVSVLRYEPGIEVLARFANENGHPILQSIGFASRQQARDNRPAIDAAALETLRRTGDAQGVLSPAARAALDGRLARSHRGSEDAWLNVCIDATGAMTSTRVVDASSALAAESFVASVASWSFRPFTVGGRALPVCSLAHLRYPSGRASDIDVLPLAPPFDALTIDVDALSGPPRNVDKIRPTRAVTDEIDRVSAVPLPSTVQFCIDESGTVTYAASVVHSGNPAWDAQLVDTVTGWHFDPFMLQGHAVAVCSSQLFIYYHR